MSLTLRFAQTLLCTATTLGIVGTVLAQDKPAQPTYQEAIRCASYLTQLSASSREAATRSTDPSVQSEMRAKADADQQQAMQWLSYSSLFGGTRESIIADYRSDRTAFSEELSAARSESEGAATAYLYPIAAKCAAFEEAFGPNLSQLTG